MATHRHRAQHTVPRPYSGPVRTRSSDQNEAAHGGIRYDETCSCGAKRSTNVNGRHRELGPWISKVTHEARS
jgi:hypothetical protein